MNSNSLIAHSIVSNNTNSNSTTGVKHFIEMSTGSPTDNLYNRKKKSVVATVTSNIPPVAVDAVTDVASAAIASVSGQQRKREAAEVMTSKAKEKGGGYADNDKEEDVKVEAAGKAEVREDVRKNIHFFFLYVHSGAFGKMYKAKDMRKEYYDNQDWEQPMSDTQPKSKFVAIKHIFNISSPERIKNEIEMLHKLKGSNYVLSVITAFKKEEEIFMVMPYLESNSFSDIYLDMSMLENINPNNFWNNRQNKTGYLIDFGLAEYYNNNPEKPNITRAKGFRTPKILLKVYLLMQSLKLRRYMDFMPCNNVLLSDKVISTERWDHKDFMDVIDLFEKRLDLSNAMSDLKYEETAGPLVRIGLISLVRKSKTWHH
ncbi:hypothetical protein BD770DRAFT_413560 [Pilaira anomala]|nr:hypothetical protein BD770DRAFT_413560 [Pilaira anomala]